LFAIPYPAVEPTHAKAGPVLIQAVEVRIAGGHTIIRTTLRALSLGVVTLVVTTEDIVAQPLAFLQHAIEATLAPDSPDTSEAVSRFGAAGGAIVRTRGLGLASCSVTIVITASHVFTHLAAPTVNAIPVPDASFAPLALDALRDSLTVEVTDRHTLAPGTHPMTLIYGAIH